MGGAAAGKVDGNGSGGGAAAWMLGAAQRMLSPILERPSWSPANQRRSPATQRKSSATGRSRTADQPKERAAAGKAACEEKPPSEKAPPMLLQDLPAGFLHVPVGPSRFLPLPPSFSLLLVDPYYLLLTTYYSLPTTHYPLPTTYPQLPCRSLRIATPHSHSNIRHQTHTTYLRPLFLRAAPRLPT